MPARRKCGPMRRSRPTPSATSVTSAPVASQTFAISLMNEMRVIERRVRRELDHLRRGDVAADDRRVDSGVQLLDDVGVGLVEGADDDPVRMHEVADRGALGRELGVRDVADVLEAALVEAVADRRGPCRPEPCSSSPATMRRSTRGSSSTTVQTAVRSASPETVGGVPTAT